MPLLGLHVKTRHLHKLIRSTPIAHRGQRPEKEVKKHRLNDEITASKVRLIDDEGNGNIVSVTQALADAETQGVDLVEVAPNGKPPVCKLMDYGKYLFNEGKQKQAAKKKQKKTQIKEIKFRPGTGENDYQVKLRNLIKFLEQGNKTKVTIRYRGRELVHQELGKELLDRVEKDLEAYGKVEQYPKFEGRQMVMVLAPISKK